MPQPLCKYTIAPPTKLSPDRFGKIDGCAPGSDAVSKFDWENKVRFAIVGSRRTGSSHLVSLLHRHPEIWCNGEIFHRANVYVSWPRRDFTEDVQTQLLELRRIQPAAFLERILAADYGRPHVGFKILIGQGAELFQTILKDTSIRKLVLFRRNVLANYSSELSARNNGRWALRAGHTPPPAMKVEFCRRDFLAFYEEYIAFYRGIIKALNDTAQSFHLINYEEINDPYLFGATLTFIGCNASSPLSEAHHKKIHLKLNSSDIVSRFVNPQDVDEFLRKNALMHWAQEGDTSLESLPEARA